jgi:hypothetical protein
MHRAMAKTKPILIACPQHMEYVRGTYECDKAGRYRLGPSGQFDLARARCGQDGGRCMQTLCALHRYNRRGPGSWYPTEIRAMPERKTEARHAEETRRGERPNASSADHES